MLYKNTRKLSYYSTSTFTHILLAFNIQICNSDVMYYTSIEGRNVYWVCHWNDKDKKSEKKMTVSSDLLVLLLKEMKKSSFSHTPLWTQTPSAFQVNHFSLVLVGWTQMETVKYYQAVITFHLSCNRSLHARYNHHLLHIVSLSLSPSVGVHICCVNPNTAPHTLTSAISSLSSLSTVLLWKDCCMLNFHHRKAYYAMFRMEYYSTLDYFLKCNSIYYATFQTILQFCHVTSMLRVMSGYQLGKLSYFMTYYRSNDSSHEF